MRLEIDTADVDRIADAVVSRIDTSYRPTQWLTKTEAAEHLRCSVRQLEKLVRLGELVAYRPAGRPLFRVEELDAYITNRRES